MNPDSRKRVRFTAPGEVEVITEDAPSPVPDEVSVRTAYSAISPGTERLVYQGQAPRSLPADATIDALQGQELSFPISYGYSCVGVVEEVGADVDEDWHGTHVFGFQPHVSRFTSAPEALVPLPDGVALTDAVMIPSLETVVTLVMDGRPMVGEEVLVFGQGVVGLLTARLLADIPGLSLTTVDPSEARRTRSVRLGADRAVAPSSAALGSDASPSASRRADLVYELTGKPSVLNDAIERTSFDGRIVVGSWYGTKRAPIDLGERFHRSRIEIHSSQVSTIAPSYRGRWTKDRRMSVVLDLLDEIHPGQLISDQFAPDAAPTVYERLVEDPPMLQPIFVYDADSHD